MNEQTLELQIKTTADGAVNSVKLLNSSLGSTKNTVDKVSNSVSKLGKAFSLGGLYVGAKRLTTQFLNWMNLAVDRTEQLNLFNVVFKNIEKNGEQTFSELGKSATQFQNKLNETFGTNFTDTTKYQGLFQSMGQNVGIADKYSAIMSETMTKLTYDLGSLYNKTEKDVAEALRAGVYAGQTKPLRAYGIDVTQTSLTPVAQSLGITDRTVKEMSQAEKEILRYIATLRQAKVAMGDYANTIESPANQTKIFKNTLVEAKVALTSLFIGTFSKILPYANAILMVIKEVSKAIATMFGIKIQDYNSGIASQAEAYEGLEDSIDGATDSAKKLKREILSFDQIHNINEDNDSGSSSGGASGLTGGIDQRLLDAINGYDNGMDKVRMKATEIRDKIMEWLGFTKHINAETGETYFTLDNTDSTMYKIIDALKGIIKYGKEAIVGVFSVIKKDFDNGSFGNLIVKALNAIKNTFKFIAEHKEVQTIIAKTVEAFLLFKVVTSILKPIVSVIQNVIKNVSNLGTNANKAKQALDGIGSAVTGIYLVSDAIKSLVKDGDNLANELEGIGGLLLTTFGGVQAGSVFGPLGALIGGIIGLVTSLGTALLGYMDALDEVAEAEYRVENSANAMTIMHNLAFNNFANYGVSCAELKNEYSKLIGTITSSMVNVSEYNNLISENAKNYDTAKSSLENLISQFSGLNEAIPIDAFNSINENIDIMVESIKSTGIAQVTATSIIVDNLVKEQKINRETANSVIDSAKLIAESQKDKAEVYRLSMLQLESQYKNGEISLEEFNIKQQELAKQYGITKEATEEATNKLSSFIDLINSGSIDPKDYEELNNLVKDINNSYSEANTTITNSYSNQKEILNNELSALKELKDAQKKHTDEILKTKGARSNEYLEAKTLLDEYEARYNDVSTTIRGLREKEREDVQNLKETTSLALLSIVSTLKKSGYDMSEDVDGVVSKIEENFKKMGININLENETSMNKMAGKIDEILGTNISKTIKKSNKQFESLGKDGNLITQYEKNGKEISEAIDRGAKQKEVSIKVGADTSGATRSMNTWVNQWKEQLDFRLSFNKANGGAFYNNQWHDIKQYANGGAPSHGSVFVAGEAGAEMVGHINGRTEVLNQSQLASVMYNAVASAMANQGTNKIELYAHTDEGVIIDRINQSTKQTGICPINIPI